MTAPWGPALDAELAYRHEQIRAHFGGRRRRRLNRSAWATQPTAVAPDTAAAPAPAPVPASVAIPRPRGLAGANAAHPNAAHPNDAHPNDADPAAAGRPARRAA